MHHVVVVYKADYNDLKAVCVRLDIISKVIFEYEYEIWSGNCLVWGTQWHRSLITIFDCFQTLFKCVYVCVCARGCMWLRFGMSSNLPSLDRALTHPRTARTHCLECKSKLHFSCHDFRIPWNGEVITTAWITDCYDDGGKACTY